MKDEKKVNVTSVRTTISGMDLRELDPEDYKVACLSPSYITKIILTANEVGLQGKKIKEIVKIEEDFMEQGRLYIDFICDLEPQTNQPKGG